MPLDPILLARIQFAFTISFHIIFPAFTIGLASFLAVLEGYWLKTGDEVYREIYKFWVKIFAVTFGMGVVSGVVMSYQFGTNWSIFADKTANVIGPLLSFEVLTAFFLEASFLGIMLFGWGKVSKRMHFASTCIVAVGTLISAFWILAANSWMQTPQGFSIDANGRLMPLDWLSIIFNPSFPYRFAHMVIAVFLTTAFVVGGVGAYYLYKKRHIPQARIMLSMAVFLTAIFAPLQLVVGDQHGLNTLKYQPTKIAAMEGLWETERDAGLRLFAIPDQKNEKNNYEVIIPHLGSLILTHGFDTEIQGLKSWPKEDRPNVIIVFFAFRIMVGLGILMILLSSISAIQYFRGKLFETPWLIISWIAMIPSGFIALLAGWFVNEVGRQPYTVYGVLRTAESVSPSLLGMQVAISLLAFIIIYAFVFSSGLYYILKLIRKGVVSGTDNDKYYKHSMEASVVEKSTTGDNNV